MSIEKFFEQIIIAFNTVQFSSSTFFLYHVPTNYIYYVQKIESVQHILLDHWQWDKVLLENCRIKNFRSYYRNGRRRRRHNGGNEVNRFVIDDNNISKIALRFPRNHHVENMLLSCYFQINGKIMKQFS